MNDYQKRLLAHVEATVADYATLEPTFGPSRALMQFGRGFPVSKKRPRWLSVGVKKACFVNATGYAMQRDDVFYAEGYAVDPAVPIPMQHAWLVDAKGRVIDPTWEDNENHGYFGIAFKREFVMEMLNNNGQECGLLVNPPLMRRYFGTADLLEAGIHPRFAG